VNARVTIIDDNGNPKGAYELAPSRIYKGVISTKYVFEFEYNQLNYDKHEAENNKYKQIEEIITSWKDGTIEEKDSVYAFHKIIEVVEGGNDDN
jgi:hypothetical protein